MTESDSNIIEGAKEMRMASKKSKLVDVTIKKAYTKSPKIRILKQSL